MRLSELPSAWLPARNMRPPAVVVDRLRAFIDADVVWDCDEGSWLVLERCDNPKRAAVVNGERLIGWRAAAYYRDEDGTPFFLDERLAEWVRTLDFEKFDRDMNRFERFKYDTADAQKKKRDDDAWGGAADSASHKWRAVHGQLGTRKTKAINGCSPIFKREPQLVGAKGGWGR